jgi:hypothetical protein
MWLFVATPLLLVQPDLGFAAENFFTGSLERVGSGSISIRLGDRRVIDAMLGNTPRLEAAAIAAEYSMFDEIEVTCESIQPVWEENTSRYQSLEVSRIRLLRCPSSEELSKLLQAVPFLEGKNLLKRPVSEVSLPIQAADLNSEGGRELAHARRVNGQRARPRTGFSLCAKAGGYIPDFW